jgi:SSS family solute:Na+ symporter
LSDSFSSLDSLILTTYLIIVLSIGFYYSRKKEKNFSDYFLAGRNVGWFAVGLSLFATNISSEHFIGLAGSGATRGLSVAQFELMAIFILIILGWFFVPVYLKSGVATIPELIEKRFDRKSRKFLASLSIAIYILTKISVTIFAGGILFYKVFGVSIYTSAIIIVLITGLYSVIGGATAVVRTQVFQAVLLIAGALTLTIFGLKEVGGFSALQEKLPHDYFIMFKSASDPDFPWTGIIFGAPIIAFWYWCTDQYIVQRVLSAKSIEDARRGSLFAAFLKILPLFILVLPGLIAVALFPEIIGDEAYSALLAGNILPVGIKGLVIAGLLSAIMSSLAGVFNTTATLFVNDFYLLKYPNVNERKLVLIGRLSTTVIVIAAILCVPLVKIISSQMYLYLQSVQAFISPPITAVVLFGLISKKINSKGAFWGLVVGELIGLSRLSAEIFHNLGYVTNPLLVAYTKINFLHFAIILFIISTSLVFGISYFTSKTESQAKRAGKYSAKESLPDLTIVLPVFRRVSEYKTNLILSGVILLIVVSVWSLWN